MMLNVNGNAYHLHSWGPADAPPVLFLHGFPEFGGTWQRVAEHLPEYRVIAPDLRGFGKSYSPPEIEAYGVGAMLPDLAGIIDAIGASLPMVAHDWGAALGYVAAAALPQKINKLVVLNGVHPVPFAAELAKGKDQADASQYMTYLRRTESTDELSADGFDKLFQFISGIGANADRWLTGAQRETYRRAWDGQLDTMINWYRASQILVPPAGQTLPEEKRLALDPNRLRISMPHLIIWGDADTALLPQTRDGVLPLCDDARVVTIPGCDHWLHHQEPAQVAHHIANFLAEG